MENRRFRSAYDGIRVSVSLDAHSSEEHGAGAIQSFKKECDINTIMAKYQRTGALTWLEKRGAEYRDVTGLDFMEAMQTVVKGREVFEDLPSSIRDRFRNDPALFLDWMHDPRNTDEAIKLGLAVARAKPEPVLVSVVTPPATPAAPPA